MFSLINKFVLGMASLRVLSGSIEILAGLLMLKSNQVEKALLINSSLAIVGPLVLIITTSLGLIGAAERFSFVRLIWIFSGVACIFIGVLKK